MSTPLSRITITVSASLIEKADTRAAREGRSRSWVLAEALRVFLDGAPTVAVRETPAASYAVRPGLGEHRLGMLKADMALTPVERLRNADASTEDGFRLHRVPRVPIVMAFERYEDYLDWKRRDVLW